MADRARAATHHLEWFPKRVAEGDMRAASETRLLQSGLEPTEVLVRELAQNAWDARDGSGRPVDFGLELRRLDRRSRTQMADLLAGPPSGSLAVDAWLREGDGTVVEVSDRSTTGLRGPVRSDLEIPEGQARNFVDFVYSVGATKPAGGGTGGTYGFGKSAAYAFSAVGTIVIWSRVESDGGRLEDRLIVSAIGQEFAHHGRRYTGRHWWGRVFESDGERRVEPLVGESARTLARSWFSRGFDGRETGTSLLILAPHTEDDRSTTGGGRPWGDRVLEAMAVYLWPKVVAVDDTPPMSVHMTSGGRRRDLADHLRGPVCDAYRRCLLSVRDLESPPQPGVRREELVHGSRRQTVADVAFTRALGAPGSFGVDPLGAVTDRVAYMRRGAELVVGYEHERPAAHEDIPWVAVMMPRAEHDSAFAEAEPAAHDRWTDKQIEDRQRRSVVTVALRRLREAVDKYLEVAERAHRVDRQPAARLGDELGAVVTGLAGVSARPSSRMASRGRLTSRTAAAPTVTTGHARVRQLEGVFEVEVPVGLSQEVSRSCQVRAFVRAAVDQDRSVEDPRIQLVGWRTSRGWVPGDRFDLNAGHAGEVGDLVLRATAEVVPDVTLRLEEAAT